MKQPLLIIGIIVIILIVGGLIYQTFLTYQGLLKDKEAPPKEEPQPKPNGGSTDVPPVGEAPRVRLPKAMEGKSIVMLVAFKDFRDEEYFVPRQIFRAAGAEVKVASNKPGTARGADGGEVPVNLLVKDINLAEFGAVVFVGGSGAMTYLDNEESYKVAREAVLQRKLLSAICISPAILAKAGVLEGKKATVWNSPTDKSAVKILEDNGAIFEDKPVIADGKIITGNGPAAAEEFGMTIVETLTQE